MASPEVRKLSFSSAVESAASLKLHIHRAKEIDEDKRFGYELESTKENLSKLKFNFLELNTKEVFIKKLVEDGFDSPSVDESKVKEARVAVKKSKERTKKLAEQVADKALNVARDYQNLQSRVSALQVENAGTDTVMTEVEDTEEVTSLRAELKDKEARLLELTQRHQQLEQTPTQHLPSLGHESVQFLGLDDMKDWYKQANDLVESFSLTKVSEVSDEAITLELIVPSGTSSSSSYSLTMLLDARGQLMQAELVPAVVCIADLERACVERNDRRSLVREAHSRLFNYEALIDECTQLGTGFTVDRSSAGAATTVHIAAQDKQWSMALSVTHDYPQSFAPARLIQFDAAGWSKQAAATFKATLCCERLTW